MTKFTKAALLAAAVAPLISAATATPVLAQAQTDPTIPIEVFALRDVVTQVQVSPNGEKILVLKTVSKTGDYLLEIYDTNDLSKKPTRLNADPMEIISANWVNDRFIYGTAWQQIRNRVTRPEEDSRSYKSFSYDTKSGKFKETDGNFSIVNLLPDDPDEVLVQQGNVVADATGVDPFSLYRPRSYYRYNLATGQRSLVLRGSDKYPTAQFDNQGNPRFTSSYDAAANEVSYHYRKPQDTSWSEFEVFDQNDASNLYRQLSGFMGLVGFDPNNPNIGYIIDNRGEDKAALFEFNFETGEFGKKLYSNPDVDVMRVQKSSLPGSDKLVAAVYPGAKWERHWFDQDEKALYEALEQQIPNSHQVSVTSRSRDGNTMVVYNSGPHDPGSYWLVKDSRMQKLGSRNPLLRPEQLADVEYISYPSRDGKTIHGYVTRPKGQGPFPLVVMPHGGPHVAEVVGFDEWAQFLASRGYMVLQPEYRMTVGYGQEFFDSAFGEHGGAMQDDKDDGALYLAKQGLVDPERMAMFGWSYGGYAALVASLREPNIYQCAIAGAAVANPERWYRETRNLTGPKTLDEWSKRRGTIGVNPVKQVAEANIPLLMIHGDVDRRVQRYHFDDYKAAMEKAGKTDAQYMLLEGADHFYNTLMYDHQTKLYTGIESFLKNDCGPGGL